MQQEEIEAGEWLFENVWYKLFLRGAIQYDTTEGSWGELEPLTHEELHELHVILCENFGEHVNFRKAAEIADKMMTDYYLSLPLVKALEEKQ